MSVSIVEIILMKGKMKEHTLLESAIERKNHYQGRMAENMANTLYFSTKRTELIHKRDKLKVDSPERAEINKSVFEADTAIAKGKDNVEEDGLLSKAFSKLISNLKKESKKA